MLRSSALAWVWLGVSAFGADSALTLPSVEITQSTLRPYEPFYTGETETVQSYTQEGIETFGAQSNVSAFKAVNMSASVNFNAVDAFGSNESAFHDPLRIRGKNQGGPGGVISLEGLPVSGNPGGGKTLYDMENIAAIDLYKGYMPVEKSLGFANLIGKVDLIVRRPSKTFGAQAVQSVGSENMSRTFVRVDSGRHGDVSAFGSFSYTQADKWKGEGDLERTNGMIGLAYEPDGAFRAELFATFGSDEHHNYYQMNYAQARNLDAYYRKDYGSDASKAAYADYNRQSFDDQSVIALFEYKINSGSLISFKPYYLHDKGEYWFDKKPFDPESTLVTQWMIDHELFGGVLAYETRLNDAAALKLGYWAHTQEPPGPPTEHRLYNVASGKPVFVKYAVLTDYDNHEFHSPFLEISGAKDAWSYKVGIRYLDFKLAGLRSHTLDSDAQTSLHYETALLQTGVDAMASVDSRHYNEWLPSLYLSYAADAQTTIYGDYARTHGFDVNLYPTYVNKRANFVPKGISLEQLWAKQKLERSDNIDVGVRYERAEMMFNALVYATFVSGKQVSAFDPELGVAYPSNIADARSYGVELSASGRLSESLGVWLNASYNRYYYTDDILTAADRSATISGNQLPDAPEYMANAALNYRLGALRLSPSVRYYSKRYGDADNTQKIPSCVLVDVDASYTMTNVGRFAQVEWRLSATNLFDRRYISSIITPDNALSANTSSTFYQAGAPLGVYAGVSLRY